MSSSDNYSFTESRKRTSSTDTSFEAAIAKTKNRQRRQNGDGIVSKLRDCYCEIKK